MANAMKWNLIAAGSILRREQEAEKNSSPLRVPTQVSKDLFPSCYLKETAAYSADDVVGDANTIRDAPLKR